MRDLYQVCVGQYGMDPAYFMDRATAAEVEAYIDGATKRGRQAWERVRLLSYIVARIGGCDAATPEEFLPLAWDEKEESEPADEEHLKRLRQSAKEMETKYGNNGDQDETITLDG